MVNRMAKGLQNLGVGKGDRVAIYMPMIPELPAALLAVARLGAAHNVVFGGFAASFLARPHQRQQGKGRHYRRQQLPRRQTDRTEEDCR